MTSAPIPRKQSIKEEARRWTGVATPWTPYISLVTHSVKGSTAMNSIASRPRPLQHKHSIMARLEPFPGDVPANNTTTSCIPTRPLHAPPPRLHHAPSRSAIACTRRATRGSFLGAAGGGTLAWPRQPSATLERAAGRKDRAHWCQDTWACTSFSWCLAAC